MAKPEAAVEKGILVNCIRFGHVLLKTSSNEVYPGWILPRRIFHGKKRGLSPLTTQPSLC